MCKPQNVFLPFVNVNPTIPKTQDWLVFSQNHCRENNTAVPTAKFNQRKEQVSHFPFKCLKSILLGLCIVFSKSHIFNWNTCLAIYLFCATHSLWPRNICIPLIQIICIYCNNCCCIIHVILCCAHPDLPLLSWRDCTQYIEETPWVCLFLPKASSE